MILNQKINLTNLIIANSKKANKEKTIKSLSILQE